MDSNNGHAQTVTPETETPLFRPASTRRTPSFSSSSLSHDSWDSSFGSSISLNEKFSSLSPNSTPLKFSGGVPFSWEQLPGIPKQLSAKKKGSVATSLLPLPPAGNSNHSKKQIPEGISPKKYIGSDSFREDPFFAALVECSKDDHSRHQRVGINLWKGSKISRTLSDRFGFINMYTSCKSNSAVSESIVYLPRPHYHLNRRPSKLK
ncbi:uncharacterized protein LOC111409495 [Olea europaea var. sylvestris]|uniref:Uncharacterized protein n=1 Tax=Olea europaea subsp. europaea TaxID=158383 RepID=A0A8S0T348_OLEEU|nr:uncharacterized protein LOC111409495 [Olea europaea var. sylvestris]CAA2998825.1 Hypothetical predicted protein [Olea europaea subsp. europaea]